MYGAIIGDVAGSYIEVLEINELHKKSVRSYDDRISILDKNISLFNDKCSCTDDSVLTVAIADAILSEESYEDKLREYGNREISLGVDAYGRSRFGGGFINWLNHNSEGNSIGNGSAMRISSVGYLFNSEKEVLEEAKKATIPSHNSKEAIDAARMVAISIYLARNNYSKADIKKYLEKNFDVYGYCDKNGITYKEEFWVNGGYIIVNFDIVVYDGDYNKQLSYINTENSVYGMMNMWALEVNGKYDIKDAYGNDFVFKDGDVMLFYTDKNLSDTAELKPIK